VAADGTVIGNQQGRRKTMISEESWDRNLTAYCLVLFYRYQRILDEVCSKKFQESQEEVVEEGPGIPRRSSRGRCDEEDENEDDDENTKMVSRGQEHPVKCRSRRQIQIFRCRNSLVT
jgi:hypothetical protein